MNAPLAPALPVFLLHPLYRGSNDEKLLITGDFLDATIKKGEPVGEIQQPLRATQAVNRFVLGGYASRSINHRPLIIDQCFCHGPLVPL